MNSAQAPVSDDISSLVKTFEARTRLARASELVRAGRFLEAEALLEQPQKRSPTRDDLDLLARIRVLEGRYDEARHYWRRITTLEGETEGVRRCLSSLDELQTKTSQERARLLQTLFVLLMLCGLLTAWTIYRLIPFTDF